jgi:EF-P beta-lysylation protein EpmB
MQKNLIVTMVANLKKVSEKLQFKLKEIADKRLHQFPFLAPAEFLTRIDPNNPNDPLLLQILPTVAEFKKVVGFSSDPLQEKSYTKVPGLIHKYPGRVLLLVTNHCAIHCRYCFRRQLRKQVDNWQKAFTYIENELDINEVILSGGDPLMLAATKLKKIISRLSQIPHIKKIRIHSRVPIVLPRRVNPQLFKAKLPIVLMIHCNHPAEITSQVLQKLKELQKSQITVFNQAVLLKGINDNSGIQVALSEKLFQAGVIPCYLHLLDQVEGAAHFYVSPRKARLLYDEMRTKLAGYLLPKLVREVDGRKISI